MLCCGKGLVGRGICWGYEGHGGKSRGIGGDVYFVPGREQEIIEGQEDGKDAMPLLYRQAQEVSLA